MRHRILAAACSLVLLAACGSSSSPAPTPPVPTTSPNPPSASTTPGTPSSPPPSSVSAVKIGITLPLTADGSGPTNDVRDGVLLAIKDANAKGLIPGVAIGSVVLDHTVDGADDLDKGVADIQALVADPSVVGVVGPFNSYIAAGQIPLSNQAGLLQCSPSTSNPDLTKGDPGSQLRPSGAVNFLRLSATDDDVVIGVADFAANVLHAKRALVIDDSAGYGIGLADGFTSRFTADGGTVVKRVTTDFHATDYSTVLSAGAKLHPDVVMFGGVTAPDGDTAAGAAVLRHQMAHAGLAGVPLVGGTSLQDQDGTDGSLIAIAGPAAVGTYGAEVTAADFPARAAFDAEFAAAYGHEPDPYAGPGYACAQLILRAVAAAAAKGTVTRDAVRSAAVAPNMPVDTIMGPVSFDAVGDITAPVITITTVDPKANGGSGGWIVARQMAVGP